MSGQDLQAYEVYRVVRPYSLYSDSNIKIVMDWFTNFMFEKTSLILNLPESINVESNFVKKGIEVLKEKADEYISDFKLEIKSLLKSPFTKTEHRELYKAIDEYINDPRDLFGEKAFSIVHYFFVNFILFCSTRARELYIHNEIMLEVTLSEDDINHYALTIRRSNVGHESREEKARRRWNESLNKEPLPRVHRYR